MPRITTPRLIAIGSLFIVGITLLFIVASNIQTGTGLVVLDQPILQWFIEFRTPILDTIMHSITTLMGAEVLVSLAVIVAAVWMWRKKDLWRPLLFTVSLAGAVLIAAIIKFCVDRYRPLPDVMVIPYEVGPSLPSIHTLGVAAFVLILGYLVCSRQPSVRRITIWVTVALTNVVLVAVTRLYLGYHWFSDTIASIGLTLVILSVVIAIDTYFTHRAAAKP